MNNLIIKMVQTKKEKLFVKISEKTCYCASAVDRYWFVFLHVFFSGKTSDIVRKFFFSKFAFAKFFIYVYFKFKLGQKCKNKNFSFFGSFFNF